MKGLYRGIWILLNVVLLSGCQNNVEDRLPVLGRKIPVTRMVDGKEVKDSAIQKIGPFSFESQSGTYISNTTLKGKVYIADFIFLSCKTVCPVMTHNLMPVYKAFSGNSRVRFVSYSIDPENDTREKMAAYTAAKGIDNQKWFFLRGNQDSVYHLAENSYLAPAGRDSSADGGFVHSGGIYLVDGEGYIRGVYEGTSPDEMKQLAKDIKTLLVKG